MFPPPPTTTHPIDMDVNFDLDSISKLDEDTLLTNCVEIKQRLKSWEALFNACRDELVRRYENGEIETPKFTFNDAKFSYSLGKTKWTYPENVTQKAAELAKLQNQAKESGTATCSRGASFWTIKLPGESGEQ